MKNKFIGNLILLFSVVYSNRLVAQDFKDVAPIFIANCASCHHQGGIQFPLTKYSEIAPLAQLIKNQIQTGSMPPWPPDPTYKTYVHQRVLTQGDKTLLLNWINNNTPAGDTTLAQQAPNYGGYQLTGTPDLILNVPTYTSAATSSDMYVCLNVNVTIPQDRMIRAFEYVPSNPSLIHHAVITIDTTGNAVDDLSGNCFNFQGQVNIGDYAPGMVPTVFPNAPGAKFGMRLKAGSKMSFQLHVPKGTSGQTDNSQLRLFFYPINETGVREMKFETALQNWSFSVPANSSITAKAFFPTSGTLPINVSLYSAFPHSHKTCTAIWNYLYKGTDTIPLIKIPVWDFHWQGQYIFQNMVKYPIGYKMVSEHVFDNTPNNPNTPNPNAPVFPGTNTDDEMLFDSYIYTMYQAGDENINIDSILSQEPLLNPLSNESIGQTKTYLNVYPNPSESIFYFDYHLMHTQFVGLKIFDVLGKLIYVQKGSIQRTGNHQAIWNARETNKNLPSGTYFYQLQFGKENVSGKIELQ